MAQSHMITNRYGNKDVLVERPQRVRDFVEELKTLYRRYGLHLEYNQYEEEFEIRPHSEYGDYKIESAAMNIPPIEHISPLHAERPWDK